MAYQVGAVTEDLTEVGVEIVAEIVAEAEAVAEIVAKAEMEDGASEAQTCNSMQAFERLVEFEKSLSSMWVFAGLAPHKVYACVTVVVVVAAGAE